MGEIADALKRANAERERKPDPAAQSADERPAPSSPPEAADAPPRPLAPPPQPTDDPAPSPHARIMADELAAQAIRSQTTIPIEYGLDQLDLHRHLALRVRSLLATRGATTLVVTSALRDEGKTTVACNLALALASLAADRNVALLDLDMRNPSVAKRMGLSCDAGFESVLAGQRRLDDIGIRVADPALDVYPSGVPHRSAHELLVEKRFALTLEDLSRRYSVVVIDTPPALIVPDANLVLQEADCWVAVAAVGKSRVRRYNEMLEQLGQAKLLGKVLDGVKAPKHQQDYYYAYGPDEGDDD